MTSRMTTPRRRVLLGLTAGTALVLVVALGALRFSSAAKADSSSCADPVTSAPTGPATVSTESKGAFGKVLVVGSGAYEDCSLYLLTSDQLHAMTGAHYACSNTFNAIGQP